MIEQRRYVRMSTVFPVEIELLSQSEDKSAAVHLQAFTRDVSAGGMCLELKVFRQDVDKQLLVPNAPQLALTIDPLFSKHPIKAMAKIAWMKRQEDPPPVRYLIGVFYTAIDEKDRARIIGHAKRLKWVPRATAVSGLVLISLLTVLFIYNQRLILDNKLVVKQLVESAEKESRISSKLFDLQKRETTLDNQLDKSRDEIKKLEGSIASLAAENVQQKTVYEKELSRNLEKQKKLDQALRGIAQNKEKLRTSYQTLQKEQAGIASTGLRQMADWIKTHRDFHTGLVASFEGDASLEDWAFTYDQSLAAQVFMHFGDLKSAEAILSFYSDRAAKSEGAYFNAYDALDSRPTESTVHVGPNVWLGLAALQYEHRVKDGRFLPMARDIGDWVIGMQDAEGGLKGGPSVAWYSTEHNLDAYAFFLMLTEETHEKNYKEAADRVLDWIKKYAYSMKEKRINRGKGDSTIATDTFSWAIAALGPEKLKTLALDPEEIMDFAEKHCEVTVNTVQPSGETAVVRGFDFAKAQNIGRGGVISTEWTAQAIVTYQILSNYFRSSGEEDKALKYLEKANFYLNELQKLIITSPSRTGQGRGCLPYASMDNADTGHGWRTPKGTRTGSVSGTAYGIFAWEGYNPFSLENSTDIAKGSN